VKPKQTCLAALVCLNLALLIGLLAATIPPTPALAQNTGLAGNYLAVCGEIQDQYDALYMLDTRSRFLHAFWWDKGQKRLVYADSRDLERDFRRNRGG
jgi:hypothetical protein